MPYSNEQYMAQKDSGERLPDGSQRLKKLNVRHRKIVALHLEGYRNKDIAAKLGMTQARICILLNDPLLQQEIAKHSGLVKQELESLSGSAVNAVREALHSDRMGDRLRGVDRFVKLREALDTGEKSETAEDIASRILANIKDSNVQINVGTQPTNIPRRLKSIKAEEPKDDSGNSEHPNSGSGE